MAELYLELNYQEQQVAQLASLLEEASARINDGVDPLSGSTSMVLSEIAEASEELKYRESRVNKIRNQLGHLALGDAAD